VSIFGCGRYAFGICALVIALSGCSELQPLSPATIGNTESPSAASLRPAFRLGHMKFFSAPEGTQYSLALGSGGNLWYPSDEDVKTQLYTIARYDSKSSSVYDVAAPCASCKAPEDLRVVEGPDHRIWFGQCCDSFIGAMDGSGQVHYYRAGPACGGTLCDIVLGSSLKDDIWFWALSGSESQASLRVGHINARTGVVQTYPVKTDGPPLPYDYPSEIILGPDGNLWFGGFARYGGKFGSEGSWGIGRVTPKGVVTEFPTSAYAVAQNFAIGPDGDLWFASPNWMAIGRMNMHGKLLTTLDVDAVGPIFQIAMGPDRHVWITLPYDLIRMTSAEVYKQFPIRHKVLSCIARALAIGPDGNLWFTQTGLPSYGDCEDGLGTFVPKS
jgi:streptogramin lyase